jgi:hypothetical protein
MRTASDNLWLDVPYRPGPALWGEHEADVAIVGGGYTGLAAAYFIKSGASRRSGSSSWRASTSGSAPLDATREGSAERSGTTIGT